MSTTQVYEIVVEYSDQPPSRHCSPCPSTSSSSSSSKSSPASSPSSSVSSSSSSRSCSGSPRTRRISKTFKKSTWSSIRRSTRKILTAGKKYAKKYTSSTASKMRLVRNKIEKQQQERMASKARLEKLRREHEELLAGNSQVAIMCESVQSEARSLREKYESQRAGYTLAFIATAIIAREEAEDEEEEYEEDHEGFIGTYYY